MLEREAEEGVKKSGGIVRIILFNLMLALLVGVALYLSYALLYVVEPVKEVYVQELGDRPQTDIHFYLLGPEKSLEHAYMDFSEVDFNTPGTYTLTVKHGYETFEYMYIIEDTSVPVISVYEDIFICETGRTYSIDDFVKDVRDVSKVSTKLLNTSGDKNISLQDEGRIVSFTEGGTYSLCVYSLDESGNSASSFLNILSESAPAIYGTTEFYVAKGSFIDLNADIFAYDREDGNIASGITNDFDTALFDKIGDHKFNYRVSDSMGLISERTGTVHIYDPLLLQDKINRGVLKGDALNVSGIINLYDSGYSVEDNIEAAVENERKAVVSIFYDKGSSRTRGSGYIVKITDSEFIVATNAHVVGSQEKVNVVIWDGTVLTGKVAAYSKAPDIAFVKVNLSELRADSIGIKTVHINRNYYEDLGNSPAFSLGVYCLYSDGKEWLRRYGRILRKSGCLNEYFEDFDYPVTQVSIDLIPGMSGSGIVDSHGNLICMATYYYEDKGIKENYCVSLNDILDFYEESFGEKLEYY